MFVIPSSFRILGVLGTLVWPQSLSYKNLTSVLGNYPDLSNISSWVYSYSAISSQISNGGNFTLLAPTNEAITRWLASSPSQDLIEATFAYHILKGVHPSASFGYAPQFLPTMLADTAYANVTGGQVVQGFSTSNGLSFQSANKTTSQVTFGDIVATGGVIHVIDSVLQIPTDALTAITDAKLNYTIGIISQWQFIGGNTGPNTTNLATLADMTIFVPNSAQALAMASNMTGLSQRARNMVGAYHLVMGNAVYSVDLVNGTSLNSRLGLPLVITVGVDKQIYVNRAKILTSDYLIYNGVFHTIDRQEFLAFSDMTPYIL
ncbi:FAS1 domain-containing protein [Leptodontidium sp. MPI-SDFR-AT-0119]|nr:FAS1 domain-containing protein [Leptodontidium sp. MPI-SDFR-AT-0119]